MTRRGFFVLAFCVAGPWMALAHATVVPVIDVSTPTADDYVITPSTPTKAVLRQMRQNRPRKAPIRQMRAMERRINRAIKRTSPNPRVQSPGTSPLPVQSPEMPAAIVASTQPTRADRFLNAAAKIMTKSWNGNIFVWLPAISTDPNSGPTVGVLPVLVLADPLTHHIRHLFAPSYTYNQLFGNTGTWRYYFYPTDASQMFTTASISQHVNREVKARYENTSARDGVLYVRAEAYYTANASNRFFGVGPQSRESDESGYTSKDSVARADLGVNFSHSWRATIGTRFRRFNTDSNIIPNVTDLSARFPDVVGQDEHRHRRAAESKLLWDTRDSPVTPSRGSSGEFFRRENQPDPGQ